MSNEDGGDAANPVEPYFTLLNCPDYFKIIFQTLDFDDSQLKPKALNSKTLYIKKEDCLIFEKADDEISHELESIEPHNQI